jgi:ferredoxin
VTGIMYITEADLRSLVDKLVASGTRVIGPTRKGQSGAQRGASLRGVVLYRQVQGYDEIVFEAAPPALSLKSSFLPKTEPLLEWRKRKDDVEVTPASLDFPTQVVVGARSCDAAALPIVDRVMDWDYHDEPWFGRRQATTVITMACTDGDASCFCTAVGLAPDATQGSDILLTPSSGGYSAEILTDKGLALVQSSGSLFKNENRLDESKPAREAVRKKVEANLHIDPEKVRTFLRDNFEHPFWRDVALRCQGCGACASVCPTCHCFDIVDEPEGIDRGWRRRNWDTCQTAKFTLHGSGHNPRTDQGSRIRQRTMHKFYIYPERFQSILCTGCGRCVRACAGGMDILEVLRKIDSMSGSSTAATAGAK